LELEVTNEGASQDDGGTMNRIEAQKAASEGKRLRHSSNNKDFWVELINGVFRIFGGPNAAVANPYNPSKIYDGGWEIVKPEPETPVVDWDALPAWAEWVAMDEDGEWWWYTHEPGLAGSSWLADWDMVDAGTIPGKYRQTYDGPWEQSLTRRPSTLVAKGTG